MAGRKRRFWSDDEKRSICRQSTAPGISVAQVARRYSMNSNLIFKWLRDARFVPAADEQAVAPVTVEHEPVSFLPVEIVADPVPDKGRALDSRHEQIARPTAPVTQTVAPPRLELDLSNGRRLRVTGACDADALARLVRALDA